MWRNNRLNNKIRAQVVVEKRARGPKMCRNNMSEMPDGDVEQDQVKGQDVEE